MTGSKICPKCRRIRSKIEFALNRTKSDGLQSWCRECKRFYDNKSYHSVNSKTKVNIRKRNERQKELIRDLIYTRLLNNSCVDCGEDDPVVLEFDHIKGKKKFNISKGSYSAYSIKTFIKELDKCEVRCANCHRRRTSKTGNHWKWRRSSTGRAGVS